MTTDCPLHRNAARIITTPTARRRAYGPMFGSRAVPADGVVVSSEVPADGVVVSSEVSAADVVVPFEFPVVLSPTTLLKKEMKKTMASRRILVEAIL